MTDSELLNQIANLSREFGGDEYVKGGGGNTSCKNDAVLFIKPSGIGLAEMRPENFLALSRDKLNALYETVFPEEENAREREVVAFMAETVMPGSSGRPSVEAPLHNCFSQRFVVHTHPPAVNGLTCGRKGAAACAEMFPEALWMPFVEPGYTLSMRVREEIRRYHEQRGRWPELLFLGNHGLFVAHDDADGVRALYGDVLRQINRVIDQAGLSGAPLTQPLPIGGKSERETAIVRAVLGDGAAEVVASGRFAIPAGAVSPDHIVYCKAHLYEGEANEAALSAFYRANGYWPRVIATPTAVYGCGSGRKAAELALQLAWDGALVVRYAGAFGGMRYLERRFVDFIANWEVESYRQKVSE